MVGHNNVTDDVIKANLEATMARGYKPFAVGTPMERPVSIVGAGPSLSWTYKDIVGDMIACNSAHDFLISKGIIPKYAMFWDAHSIIATLFTPHKDVSYIVASRCHPDVFKKLDGFDVRVAHVLGDSVIEQVLIEHGRMEPMIGGGSSSVTRATYLGAALGYRGEMHLFGIDSSCDEKTTHVIGSVVPQNTMKLRVCGKWFLTVPWMAMQAGDFKSIVPHLQNLGYRLTVHGTGLIPYCATFMAGVKTPNIKVSLYEKIRRELHMVILLFLTARNSPQLLGGSHAGV